MKLDRHSVRLIKKGMEGKNINKGELAKALGLGASWASKLFSEDEDFRLKTLDDDKRVKLESMLGIKFYLLERESNLSPLAMQAAKLIDSDSNFAAIVEGAMNMRGGNQPAVVGEVFAGGEMGSTETPEGCNSFTVRGSSMEPDLADGDVVVIDAGRAVEADSHVVVQGAVHLELRKVVSRGGLLVLDAGGGSKDFMFLEDAEVIGVVA